jgi:hypothetical protein
MSRTRKMAMVSSTGKTEKPIRVSGRMENNTDKALLWIRTGTKFEQNGQKAGRFKCFDSTYI